MLKYRYGGVSMEFGKNVDKIKMACTCRVCATCGRYIFYGQDCVKETVHGPRKWHHLSCWENELKNQEED